MRRLGIPGLILGLVLTASLVAGVPTRTRAQEAASATPTPAVLFEPVADGVTPPLVADQAGVDLELARFEAGASYTVPVDDEGLLLVAVESGTLTVSSSTPLIVNRASMSVTEGAQAHELLAAGAEIALGAGDSFVRPPDSEQVLRNASEDFAIAFMASVARGEADRASGQSAGLKEGRGGAGVVVAVAVVVVPECPDGYDPAEVFPAATPGGGGGGGGAGGVAVAIAAAPECVGGGALAATPVP